MADTFRFAPKITNTPKAGVKTKLAGRIKLSEFFELDEKAFREKISSHESHPLFLKLFSPGPGKERAITYARPHRLKLF